MFMCNLCGDEESCENCKGKNEELREELEGEMYAKSLLEQEATIRTWHFMWRFPFIKIVDFTGDVRDMQKLQNTLMNQAIDSTARRSK